MVKRNTTIISQKEYDDVRMEYGIIVKKSVIPKGDDVMFDEVWNVYTIKKVHDHRLN